jgi:hypothetical protein
VSHVCAKIVLFDHCAPLFVYRAFATWAGTAARRRGEPLYPLSLRQLEEIMPERNLSVDHVTIWRWVQQYAPELNRRNSGTRTVVEDRRDLLPLRASRRVFTEQWTPPATIDFFLSAKRDADAAKRAAEAVALARSSTTESDQRGWESIIPEGH